MLELGIASVSTDLLGAGTSQEYKHLPEWSDLALSAEPGRATTLTFKYPKHGVRANMLIPGARIRVRFPLAYTENVFVDDASRVDPPNMILELDEDTGNEETANDRQMTYAATSLFGNFKQLLLAPAEGSSYVDDDLFTYSNLTVGSLLKQALSVGLSRSPETSLELSFDEHKDSLGNSWGNPIDAKFTPGQSVEEVLGWLRSLGFAYTTLGYNKKWMPSQDPETVTSDLWNDSTSTTYRLNAYQEPLEGFNFRSYYLNETFERTVTRQRDFKNVVNKLFVTGDDGICTWVSRQDSIEIYGVREGKWGVSNAGQMATLKAAAERYLDAYAYPRQSQTLDIEFPPDGAILFWFPKFIFGKSREEGHEHRIEMLSLRVQSANHIGTMTLTLDNYFDRRTTMLEQRLARLGLSK